VILLQTDEIYFIKKLTLLSLLSDETLLERLVLKGGNALDIVYDIASRSSIDLDFSIEDEFDNNEKEEIFNKIKEILISNFKVHDYHAFDIRFTEKPPHITEDMKDFWGGYMVEFKVIKEVAFKETKSNLDLARKTALELGPRHKKPFKIEISKFECCKYKTPREIEGQTIYVYTPLMMIFEKLRAICQQMPEYAEIVNRPSQSARARDFYDIYTILEGFRIDISDPDNYEVFSSIFEAKRVPTHFLSLIEKYREFHRPDFVAVEGTVKAGTELKEFDFYFDYILENCVVPLETFWKK